MEKVASPMKSPPQLSPPPISIPYSPNNNNNSPPDICSDVSHLLNNFPADSPPRLQKEVQSSSPKLSPDGSSKFTSIVPSEQSEKDSANEDGFVSPTPSTSSKKSVTLSPGYFTEGMDVLARWSDGMVYLGTILKVDEVARRCFLVFEDKSEYWTLFKDIQKGRNYTKKSQIICEICEEGSSESPNEIVICEKCELGFHQLCHRPKIDSRILLTPDEPWYCRQCVFANSAKIGGALKRGPGARVFQEFKKNLPYTISELNWDKGHKTNSEKSYCYCGGPGDWYLKMLQCCRCKQWFHEACVQCLDVPMMYGDRFYIFVCSVCNDGPEYLKRLPIKWVDLAHLLIYNLTLMKSKKYYDFDTDIMPFLSDQWSNLKIAEFAATTRLEKHEHMLTALKDTKKRFTCGIEHRQKKTLWGLRVRNPPVPPKILLPAAGQINDEVMNDLRMKGRKVVTFVPVPSTSPVPLIRKKKGKKRGAGSEKDLEKMDKQSRKRFKEATTTGVAGNAFSKNQSYKGYRGTDNLAHLLNLSPVKKGQSVLDSIQPLESTFRCGGRGQCRHKIQDELINVPMETVAIETVTTETEVQKELRGELVVGEAGDGASCSRSLRSHDMSVIKALPPPPPEKNCNVCCTSLLCTEHSPNQRRIHKKKRRRKARRESDSPIKSPSISPRKSPPIRTSLMSKISFAKSTEGSPAKFASKSPTKSPTKTFVKSPTKTYVKSPQKSPSKFSHASTSRSPLKSPKLSPTKSTARISGSPPPVGRYCMNGAVSPKSVSLSELRRSISSYFGAEGRLACGERYNVLGKRVAIDGKVQYLIQWEGTTP